MPHALMAGTAALYARLRSFLVARRDAFRAWRERRRLARTRMSLGDHLRVLRKRLLWAFAGIAVGIAAGWFAYTPILDYLQSLLRGITGQTPQLNFQTIGAALDLQVNVAIWSGIILSSPWWILQICLFIGPGLMRREKLFAAAFGFAGTLLFVAGAWVGVMCIPEAVVALSSFVPEDAAVLLRADAFVAFCVKLVLAFGLSFLIPELLVALNFAGILRTSAMLHGWRWATIIAFTFAAIANPVPNPVPMIIQALVLLALYGAAIGISALHERAITRHHQPQTAATTSR